MDVSDAALALLGAVPDRSQAVRHCKAKPKDAFCRYVRFFKDAGKSKPIAGLKDERIAAAVVDDLLDGGRREVDAELLQHCLRRLFVAQAVDLAQCDQARRLRRQLGQPVDWL